MRSFEVKVNRKARRAALRGALSAHAQAGTLGLVDGTAFEEPSTKTAVALVEAWAKERPLVVVVSDDDVNLGLVVPEPREGRGRRAVRARRRRRRLGPLAARLAGGARRESLGPRRAPADGWPRTAEEEST